MKSGIQNDIYYFYDILILSFPQNILNAISFLNF